MLSEEGQTLDAREISLRGQRAPKNGTLAIRGGWCPQHWTTGVGPGRGAGVRCVARN